MNAGMKLISSVCVITFKNKKYEKLGEMEYGLWNKGC